MTSIGARGAIGVIGLYRRMPRLRPPVCRYEPTCSSYSVQAIERFGLVKGIFMSVRRVGRCNPWGGTGLDPVPSRKGVSTDV